MKTQTQYFSDKLMSTYLFNPPKSLHPSAVWPCSAVRKVGSTMHSGTQRIDIHQHHHESSLYSQKLTKNICTIFCPLCVPKEGNKLLRADDSPLTACPFIYSLCRAPIVCPTVCEGATSDAVSKTPTFCSTPSAGFKRNDETIFITWS